MKPSRGMCAFAFAIALSALAGAGAQAQPPAAEKEMTPSGPVDGPIDLATALKRFPLTESARTARELVPNWTFPSRMVVIVDRPERTQWLQAAMPAGVTVVGVPDNAAAMREMGDANAFILANGDCGVARGRGTADMWKSAPKLEWLHSGAGGTDQCMAQTALANGNILLTNSQKVKSDGLMETAFGYIFALARNLDVALDNQRRGSFDAVRATRPVRQLEGATMLIVGLGGAGTEIARVAHELGMTVIATRASSHEGPAYVEYVGLSDELPDLIGRADIVVIAAPLTPQTRGLFNSAMFSRMKRGAMLVDFTRAEIVVPDDLAAALKDGRVGSAGLFWATNAPLPKNSPLWTAPNLILTSWSGAASGVADRYAHGPAANPKAQRDDELRWLLVRENMRRFAAGEKMYSVVNIGRGY
ncbi:MAG TPA: NAD(P)-dependent oxidoreductase [Rhizomicrobium sp.]|nr:NAD(P)-dependent oxidoreductase [Rhizomicrobium sp.]